MVQPQPKELSMRGDVERTEDLFSYVALADRVPSGPPAALDPGVR